MLHLSKKLIIHSYDFSEIRSEDMKKAIVFLRHTLLAFTNNSPELVDLCAMFRNMT